MRVHPVVILPNDSRISIGLSSHKTHRGQVHGRTLYVEQNHVSAANLGNSPMVLVPPHPSVDAADVVLRARDQKPAATALSSITDDRLRHRRAHGTIGAVIVRLRAQR